MRGKDAECYKWDGRDGSQGANKDVLGHGCDLSYVIVALICIDGVVGPLKLSYLYIDQKLCLSLNYVIDLET